MRDYAQLVKECVIIGVSNRVEVCAYSSKVGHEVTIITHRQEQADAIHTNGLKLKRKARYTETYFPAAIPIDEWTDGVADCIMIAVYPGHDSELFGVGSF